MMATAEMAGFEFEGEAEPQIDRSDRAALDAHLDRLLERYREREAEIATTNEIARRRIEDIQAWRDQQNESAERELSYLRHQIESWADGYDYGRKKSRSLPSGSFGYRARRDSVQILDMDAAVQFAEAHGLEVRRIVTVGKTPLLKYVQETGEIPPGTELVPGGDEFYVRTSGGEG